MMFSSVRVPAFEFTCNLVVCPLQGDLSNVSESNNSNITIFLFIQGESKFYVLMNNFAWPKPTEVSHWLEYLPGYMYCFLPSLNADEGTVHVYDYVPDFLLDFL